MVDQTRSDRKNFYIKRKIKKKAKITLNFSTYYTTKPKHVKRFGGIYDLRIN